MLTNHQTLTETEPAVERDGHAGKRCSLRATDIAWTRHILHGETASPEQMLDLATRLLESDHAGYARRLMARLLPGLDKIEDTELRLGIVQVYALASAKDFGAQSHQLLQRALSLLKRSVELSTTADPAILKTAGALHRRLWELGGQKHHLVRGLSFYQRAYQHGNGLHKAYAGISAAFLLDVLAHTEEREAAEAGAPAPGAAARRQEARHIREDIAHTLPEMWHEPHQHHLVRNWDFVTTVAEAFFGLKRYQEACEWLDKAGHLHVSEPELEATARHFGMLTRLQEGPPSADPLVVANAPGWSCLRSLTGGNLSAVTTAAAGKLGLALSGGGFRAALFHVGVLARLAELDVLRSVEVLSCVSGGSIIGAHYYLEVRKLLQEKADAEITREDYIAIVQRIERDLLAGIQENIRMLVAADGLAILRVLFDRDYSRTVRAGELYEREIYARIEDDKVRKMRDLKIIPRDGPANFHPRHHNWRRRAKVPVIVVNATTLNTGHNWQFTTTWMGEPPSGIPREVDSNERLRRVYYHQAPPPHDDISLGKAVAASACVPGIFEPVTLSGLYPRHIVRLVDGGVHDNQGIGGILDERCKVVLVSDASGQMDTEYDPGTNVFAVLSRADNIARVHVRAAQYDGLETRCRAALLHHLMFLHLKKDLDVPLVNWIGCQDPNHSPHTADGEACAVYGIPKKLQRLLAAVRTDLDSFSDQEAYALMVSGYHMTRYEFPRRVEGFPKEGAEVNWRFRALEPALIERVEPHHGNLRRILDVARFISFKIWRLAPGVLAALLLLAGVCTAGAWLVARANESLPGWIPAAGVVAGFVALYVLARLLVPIRAAVPTPIPEILSFLLWVSSLLVLVEILWYARRLWIWGTGFSVGTGVMSWVLALASAIAGLIVLLLMIFICTFLLTVLLRSRKSWSEVAIGLGFIFFLPMANLHLLTYDRWYLWRGRVAQQAAASKAA